jgi:hypothetical protein
VEKVGKRYSAGKERDEIDRIAAVVKATHSDFRYRSFAGFEKRKDRGLSSSWRPVLANVRTCENTLG